MSESIISTCIINISVIHETPFLLFSYYPFGPNIYFTFEVHFTEDKPYFRISITGLEAIGQQTFAHSKYLTPQD